MEPQYRLPDGRYTMLNASIRLTYGGATRSQLLRARLFSEHTGQLVELATFDAYPEYATERELLASKGLLTPQIRLRNLYEELATASDLRRFSAEPSTKIPSWFEDSLNREFTVEYTKNGVPWRRAIDVNNDRKSFYFQYLRSDGSIYATVDRRQGGSDWDRQDRGVVLTDAAGVPVAAFDSIPALINNWIRIIGQHDRRHFLIFDSKESGRLISEQSREENQFLILTAHTPHLQPPRHWNSPAATLDWQETVEGLRNWDAFIVLSDAHREDLELAEGKLNNIFVLPHPIPDVHTTPADVREPHLAMIVCRLEKQKRIQDALQAFRLVVDRVPEAKLEIYGEGSKRDEWQELTYSLGLTDAVSFKGYDPHPGKQYQRASAFLMTSLFEAQPLSLLEALAHGSPIVAYDIKYGPAQMVRHGDNGYLIPEGDIEDFAEKTAAILGDRALSARMAQASYEMSENFRLPSFFTAWNDLLEKICLQKEDRRMLTRVVADVDLPSISPRLQSWEISERDLPDICEVLGNVALRTDSSISSPRTEPTIQFRVHHPHHPNVLYLTTEKSANSIDACSYSVKASVSRDELKAKFPEESGGFQIWCEITLNNSHKLLRCKFGGVTTWDAADPSGPEQVGNANRGNRVTESHERGRIDHSGKILRFDLLQNVAEIFDRNSSANPDFIHLQDSENTLNGRSILQAAHQDGAIRKSVIALANRGYYVYHTADGVSKFVKDEHIPRMWHSVLDGTYSVSNEGVVHILERPRAAVSPRKLIVVFSSIGDIFNEGLFRYFTRNYRSIQKFVPQDAAILRIADIGGVVGSFYLNTTHRPDNTRRIRGLIEQVRQEFGLTKDDVVTYGASKGATGALFHAVSGGYKAVAVEPIVNDHYYETSFGDTHFTGGGTFPATKESVFEELIAEQRRTEMARSKVSQPRIVVIYSEQSPQFRYINELLGHHSVGDISLVNVTHPDIKDHPDVSPASLNLTATFLNMMCYGFAIPGGSFSLRCE